MEATTSQRYDRRGRRTRSPLDDQTGPPWRGGGRGRGHGEEPFDGRPGRSRMRRGDVRSALLIALLEGPGHGYELIHVLEAKTDGRWKPSPGSVYPTLQLLADEGLVTSSEREGKRVFDLTDAGRTHAEEHIATRGYPWDAMDRGGQHGQLRTAARALHLAARQVGTTGTPEQIERAAGIVDQARKDLYRLLAED